VLEKNILWKAGYNLKVLGILICSGSYLQEFHIYKLAVAALTVIL